MIIDVIDIEDVAGVEPKRDTPIGRNPYRVMALQFAAKGVKPETGKIHIRRLFTFVEQSQYAPEFA